MKRITATAMDPAGMPASRAFQYAPFFVRYTMYTVGTFVMPIAQYFTDKLKTTKASANDLVEMTVGPESCEKRGYFIGQKPAECSPISMDEVLQQKVWDACMRWAKLEGFAAPLPL